MNLSLDQQTLEMTCPECEEEFLVIRGSVFDAEAPIGLYLLALHGHTPGGPIAHLAIALLDPETEDAESEEGSAAPTAVAMDVVPEDGDFGFVLIDWRDSTWQTESYLGEQIDRGEALEHARKSDFFQVAGYVVRSLPDVTAYLFPDSDAAHGDR